MEWALPVLLLVIFFACVAMSLQEGLWGNAIMFFNVMTAALLATNYFEPFADWMNAKADSYTYLLDFLSLWTLFCGILIAIRYVTDKLSRTKVRFKMPVDRIGGIFFGAWMGWIMVCFTAFSLHTAPLARTAFGGAFQEEPASSMFFGLSPDRKWLAFVHSMSIDGSLARGRNEGDPATANVFDPDADFVLKYGARRKAFESIEDIRVRPNGK